MKFAHFADCHLGGWRDKKMTDANGKAFEKIIDRCILENVDFVLIAGDLFHTALPPVDKLTLATKKLHDLKQNNIPVYIIAGGHDFSPSGKTMLNVLEEAGLVINVCKGSVNEKTNKLHLKFTTDSKTGIKITGILGRKGMLDRSYYEDLDREHLEKEQGKKIFMFHTALTEFKPENLEEMDSSPLSLLPKGFMYYAGGHVHTVMNKSTANYTNITYPGPTFPNNFKELEELKYGGFYLVDDDDNDDNNNTENKMNNNNNHDNSDNNDGTNVQWIPIKIHETINLLFNANNKTPTDVTRIIKEDISTKDFTNTIVLLRIIGRLQQGNPHDIDFKGIQEILLQKNAINILRNTAKLETDDFESIQQKYTDSTDIEQDIISEHAEQIKQTLFEDPKTTTKELITSLNIEKEEGERNIDFENRLINNIDKILKINN